jgi:hypothetical protein
MTLIISAATSDFIVQVSDRRLTAGSVVKSEQANKGAVAIVDGKRFVTSFTGLAQAPKFNTIKILGDCAHDFMSFAAEVRTLANFCKLIGSRFQEKFATNPWLKRNASNSSCALYIFVSVFDADGGACYGITSNRPTLALSNQTFGVEEFKLDTAVHPGVLIIGQHDTVGPTDRAALQELASTGVAATGLVSKIVEVMRKSATSENVTIGRNLSSIIAPRDPAADIQFDHFTDQPSNTLYIPDQTFLTPNGPISIRDMQIIDPNQTFIPPGHPNDLCPCGSGKKMRECHGREGNPGGWRVDIRKIS